MGQLERYGLYVLVVVIFLILGVAIWGGDPASGREGTPVSGADLSLTGRSDAASGNAATASAQFATLFDAKDRYEDVVTPGPKAPGAKEQGAGARPPAGGTETQNTVGPVEPAGKRTHTIADGETLEQISMRYYGSKHQWSRIVEANPGLRPNAMRIGVSIVIPPAPDAATSGAEIAADPVSPASPTTHAVRDGDSPAKIAKRYYGNEKYADLIMSANGIDDPRKLRVGAVLVIPSAPAGAGASPSTGR